MPDRYFASPPIHSHRVTLTGPEAHHLTQVMRAAPGMSVVLFDGSGAEFPAEVVGVTRGRVDLAVGPARWIDRELPMAVVLGVALPKGDRQRWLVEKAVELGVARLVPLETARSVARPAPQAVARLRRQAVEAAKQCGRNDLMEVAEPRAWSPWLAESARIPYRYVAHPGGAPAGPCLEKALGDTARQAAAVHFAVGPEGGFTAEEIGQAEAAGFTLLDLGPRTLRTETAALAMAAAAALSLAR